MSHRDTQRRHTVKWYVKKGADFTTIKGIDCSSPITKAAAEELYKQGYRFVCRYLVPQSYPKHLSAAEAQLLSDAGFKILCVFETTASRAKGGAAYGMEDGALAMKAAERINMPVNGFIFFAVDFDALDKDMNAIEAYLRAAASQTGDYKIGVYGSFRVVETMADREACDGFWQTYAWSGKNKPIRATVYQYLNNQTLAGINVDFDEAYSDIGMWNYINDSGSALNMTIDQVKTELTTIAGTGNAHSAWADAAVTKLTNAGVFGGDGQGNFGWEQCMTREAVAVAFYNMLEKLGLLGQL